MRNLNGRFPTRRRVLLGLLAAVLASAAPMAAREAGLVPRYGHYTYYDSTRTQIVGEGSWNCNGTFTRYWGVTSEYWDIEKYDCSGGSILE